MKRPAKRTIYNNYDTTETYDYIANHQDEFFPDDEEGAEHSEEEILDAVRDEDELSWEIESANMKAFFTNPNGYVITGTVGLWDGPSKGGKVFTDWDDLWNSPNPLKDCDYFDFYDVNGHFHLKSSSHDGTNYLEIKELTTKGRSYYDNNPDLGREEMCEKLMNDPHYSRLPRFAEKVYGCPVREYV